MQTFLPYPDYRTSALCLDNRRLGKQRVEGLQILHNLLGKKVVPSMERGPQIVEVDMQHGWANHPIVLMWQENINSLAIYTIHCCEVWMQRGCTDTVKKKIGLLIPGIRTDWQVKHPKWLGDPAFHLSHRSNLIKKEPSWYRDQLGWTDPNDIPYIWPRG